MRKTITQKAAKPKSKSSSQVAQKKRVEAYTRVSTEQDKQLNSLAVQQRYFEKFINKNPEWTNAGIYYDDGISGTSLKNRDCFNRLISDTIDIKTFQKYHGCPSNHPSIEIQRRHHVFLRRKISIVWI